MFISSTVLNTFRAMALGVEVQCGLSHDADVQEAAAAYAFCQWQGMRVTYHIACVLAIVAFRATSLMRYGRSLDGLSALQVKGLLERWSRFPSTMPGDFVRAISLFFLMAMMDHPTVWRVLQLPARESYEHFVRVYHDLPRV